MMTTQEAKNMDWKYDNSLFLKSTDPDALGVWSELDVTSFMLRGPNYLEDSVKQKSAPAAFSLAGVEILGSSAPLYNVATKLPSLATFLAAHPEDFFVVVNRVVPGPPYRNVVTVARRTLPKGEDLALDKVVEEFVSASPEIRDTKFKYVCSMDGAPWMVKVAVEAVGGKDQ